MRDEKRANKKSKITSIPCRETSSLPDLDHMTTNIGSYFCQLDETMVDTSTTNLMEDMLMNKRPSCISCQKQKPFNSFNRQWISSSIPVTTHSKNSLDSHLTGLSNVFNQVRKASGEKSEATNEPKDDLKLIFSHENNNRNNLFNKQLFQLNLNSTHQPQAVNSSDKIKDNHENLCNNCWVIFLSDYLILKMNKMLHFLYFNRFIGKNTAPLNTTIMKPILKVNIWSFLSS